MSKPVIGIVCTKGPDPSADEREIYYVGAPYVQSIVEAGGLPVLLPFGVDVSQVAEMIDGWMIIGGKDIDPGLYGQSVHQAADLEWKARTELESNLYNCLPQNVPVLGICYGCQFLNIKRGGDLIQHLPDAVGHGEHSGGTMQSYDAESGSLLAEIAGTSTITGRSYHHQAVGRVGSDLRVTAKAQDGTIEALEDTRDRWVLGIQWHPERTPELPESKALFKAFVDEASDYQKTRTT